MLVIGVRGRVTAVRADGMLIWEGREEIYESIDGSGLGI